MAAIPLPPDYPTLAEVDKYIEASQDTSVRPYLGMSSIGDPCSRKLWYGFRWCVIPHFNAVSLKRFADGHYGEDVQAARLQSLPFINLLTHESDGKQFGASDLNGHFKGHADGFIKGILEAPKTWHVWEHKQTADKKQRALEKLINEDEKAALEKWDVIYYAQALLYMDYFDMTRHYLTCASAGGRTSISVRTNASKTKAKTLKQKAQVIITSATPPPKVSENTDWYQCRMCDKAGLCHGKAMPRVNCRTCCHSTPEMDGEPGRWSCKKRKMDIDENTMLTGCEEHLYIPTLLRNHAEAVDANHQALSWVEYAHRGTGETFKNGEGGFSSGELYAGMQPQEADA